MSQEIIVSAVVNLVTVLVGAGAGSYWGIKGALNGLRESSRRVEYDVTTIRDDVKELKSRSKN